MTRLDEMTEIRKLASSASPRMLHARLAKQAAGLGGDPENEFERNFASLAYTYVKDKAPMLIDYLVGFQLVDRAPDNMKAAGVFGCKVGDQWFYLPSIFVNNEIKGQEICYLKKQNLCIPLKENWINYVLGQQPGMLGTGSSQSIQSLGVTQPDYASLATPPMSKYSQERYKLPELKKWATDSGMFRDIAKLAMDPPSVARLVHMHSGRSQYKVAGWGVPNGLERLLSQSPRAVARMTKIASQYPLIGKAISRWYGNDFLTRMGKQASAAQYKKASLLRPVPAAAPNVSILGKQKQATSAPLQVLTREATTWLLTSAEKEAMLRDGYVVRDNRTEKQASVVVRMEEFEPSLMNPDVTGIFDVLTDANEMTKCLVLVHPHSRRGRLGGCTVIRLDGEKKDWCNYGKSMVFTRPREQADNDAWTGWYDSLKGDGNSLTEGSVYVVVGKGGSGTVPFRVDKKIGEDSYSVWFLDHMLRSDGPYSDYPMISADRFVESVPIDQVRFNQRKGTRLHSIANTLYLPDDCKVIRISKAKEQDSDGPCCPYDSSEEQVLSPGNLADLTMQLRRKTSALCIVDHGALLTINRTEFRKTAGILHLIQEHGLRQADAEALVKEAEVHNLASVRVKYAQELPMILSEQPGTSISTEDPYGPASMPGFSGGASLASGGERLATAPFATQQPGGRMRMPVDSSLLQMAQLASQNGDKELFDTSALGSLLKETNEDQLISEFVSDWLGSLDKLGRMILVFYWHNEELAERFGEKDLPRLEDVLRNAFDVLGDVVLFVQEKTVEPLGHADSKVGPDISDASR